MEDYPRNLLELEKLFSTEESCREYLIKMRWPEGIRCPRCGNEKNWPLKKGLFQCSGCDYKMSVTAGTIFEGTRMPLALWFRAIWHLTSQKNGVNALGMQRVLGFGSYETAWAWLHKLRRAMVRPGHDKLLGRVEVDETYIGGEKPGKRGRGAFGKTLVIIAAETHEDAIGRIRLLRVVDASAASLEEAVKETVEIGSVILTDGWRGYNNLKLLSYHHEVVRQEADTGNNLLPHCHRVASLIKRWLMGAYQGSFSHKHLDYYLDEYTFRFNRRTSRHRGKLFYRLIQQAVVTRPFSYNFIVTGKQIKKMKKHNI